MIRLNFNTRLVPVCTVELIHSVCLTNQSIVSRDVGDRNFVFATRFAPYFSFTSASRFVNASHTFVCQQGFGMLLMEEAERIARDEHGSVKIAVISGTTNRVLLQFPMVIERTTEFSVLSSVTLGHNDNAD